MRTSSALPAYYRTGIWTVGTLVFAALVAAAGVANGLMTGILILGAFVAVGVLALATRAPAFAPFAAVAALVYDKRIYYNYETLQLTTLVVILALTAPAFLVATARSKNIPKHLRVGGAMLAAGLVLSAAFSAHPDIAFVGVIRWLLVLNMIVGTAAMCLSSVTIRRRLSWAVLWGGAIASGFAVLQKAGIYFLVGSPFASDVYNSTFSYYSNFANFAAVAGVVGVGVILDASRTRQRFPAVALVLTAASAYGALTSTSRGALICLGIGLALIVLKQVRRPGRFILAIGTIAGVAWLLWSLVDDAFKDRLMSRFIEPPRGDLVRQQMQQGGIELLDSSPLGIGFNNFSQYVSSGKIVADQALAHSHNTFLQMGLDAGWLGLLGFVILAAGAAWSGYRLKESPLRLGAAAAVVAFLAQVTQDFFFFEAASLAAFGIIVALASSPTTETHVAAPTEASMPPAAVTLPS